MIGVCDITGVGEIGLALVGEKRVVCFEAVVGRAITGRTTGGVRVRAGVWARRVLRFFVGEGESVKSMKSCTAGLLFVGIAGCNAGCDTGCDTGCAAGFTFVVAGRAGERDFAESVQLRKSPCVVNCRKRDCNLFCCSSFIFERKHSFLKK